MSRQMLLAALLLCAGCHNAPAADAHEQRASQAPPAASIAASATASAARPEHADAAPSLPPYLPDGCWGDVATDAGARPLLDSVAKRCAQGMQPLVGKPLLADLAEGKQAQMTFKLDNADKCVRVVAAAGPGVSDLALSLMDAKGHVYGRDALEAPFALVDDAGPVCLPGKGTYRAVVRVRRGSGRVAVGVYRAK